MKDKCLNYMREALGNPNAQFREGQWEAIEGVLQGRRQLVVQQTGWGKSMIYFLATRLMRQMNRGKTLIVSPLLALMRNQTEAAARVGLRCLTVNSSLSREENEQTCQRILTNDFDLLIVSPERLSNVDFMVRYLLPVADTIGLLVVDEAHCISDWGHDFRPDYRRIVDVLARLPQSASVLATTATANNRVLEDIRAQLGGTTEVHRGALVRRSLYLQTIEMNEAEKRLAWLAKTIPSLQGSGIVYTLTTREAVLVARWLRQNGISACAYFSDVKPEYNGEICPTETDYRTYCEQRLLANQIRVLVATTSLGMGFDKPDLRFVIHYQRPKSVIDYYQQVGRAGRNGRTAYGILLRGDSDDSVAEYFIESAFPTEKEAAEVLGMLKTSEVGLRLSDFEVGLNMKRARIRKVLDFLKSERPAPIACEKGSTYRLLPAGEHYILPLEQIEKLHRIRCEEIRHMEMYVHAQGCLNNFIADELDSACPEDAKPCGHCKVCNPAAALPETVPEDLEQQALAYLSHLSVRISPRKRWVDAEAARQTFGVGSTSAIAPELLMSEGKILTAYGRGPLGRAVRQGKYKSGSFDGILVAAAAELIARWKFDTPPTWIAAIPSLRHPALVPDFARRLGKAVGLPFVDCLRKSEEREEQKKMNNSLHQQRNLMGVFAVVGTFPKGPCLLVDDMVDSGWTLTVAAAYLRNAGADRVYPLALADASNIEE